MRYVYSQSIDNYETIYFHSDIKFNNDTLRFKNIRTSQRYLYYAKNNTFEIEVNNDLLKYKTMTRRLARHGAEIKLYITKKSLKNVYIYIYMMIYILYIKRRFPEVEFNPKLFLMEHEGTEYYILDGHNVNEPWWDYRGTNLYAIKDVSKIPFAFTLTELEKQVDFPEDENLIGARSEECQYCIYNSSISKPVFKPIVYIYSCQHFDEGVIVSVLFNGYNFLSEDYEIISSADYEILDNDDWKYYSKKAHFFKENFKKIKLYDKNVSLQFKYKDRYGKVALTRDLQNRVIYNDLYFVNRTLKLDILSEVDNYKNEFYIEMENKQKQNDTEIYLFQDRQDVADDNAEALYNYYMNKTNKDIYFVVEEDTSSWNRLEEKGFKLLAFGSDEHKEKYLLASKLISSHAARRIYDPFYPSRRYVNLEKFKFVFLQHGIIMGAHHGFLDKVNNRIDLLITSTDKEAELVKNFSGFTNVPAVGLARYDNYRNTNEQRGNFITYAPSWNVKYKEDLENSDYVREIEKVLCSTKIHQLLLEAKIDLYLIFHPEFIKEEITLKNPFDYQVLKSDEFLYSEVLSETIGLITDYSSLFFDVLYQDKFVVHHKPYELHHENNMLEGYQEAIFESFTIEELEKIFTKLADSSFKNDDEKSQVIRKFFKYYDNKQSERTYLEIEKL